MVYCCVPFCKMRQVKGVSFHEFPSNAEQREKWLKAVSRKNFKINSTSASSVVCEKHFKPTDYLQTKKNKRLKAGAVPSIFKGYPKYLQKVSPKKRSQNRQSHQVQITATNTNSQVCDYS